MNYRYATYAAILGLSLTGAVAAQAAQTVAANDQTENRTTDQLNRQQLPPQQQGQAQVMPSQTAQQPNPSAGTSAASATPDQKQMINSPTTFRSFH